MLSFVVPSIPGVGAVVPDAGYFMDKLISYHVYLQILKVAKLVGIVVLVLIGLYIAYRLYQTHGTKKKRR